MSYLFVYLLIVKWFKDLALYNIIMPMGKLIRVRRQRPLNFRQIKQVQKMVKKDDQLKVKVLRAVQAVGTTASVIDLSAVANDCTIHGIHLSVDLSASQNETTATSSYIVCAIARWRPGGPPDTSDFATNSMDNDKWFYYYYKSFYLPDFSTEPIRMSKKISLKNAKIPHINIDNDGNADSSNNGLYLLLISSENTNKPNVYYHTRFSYYDYTND